MFIDCTPKLTLPVNQNTTQHWLMRASRLDAVNPIPYIFGKETSRRLISPCQTLLKARR